MKFSQIFCISYFAKNSHFTREQNAKNANYLGKNFFAMKIEKFSQNNFPFLLETLLLSDARDFSIDENRTRYVKQVESCSKSHHWNGDTTRSDRVSLKTRS